MLTWFIFFYDFNIFKIFKFEIINSHIQSSEGTFSNWGIETQVMIIWKVKSYNQNDFQLLIFLTKISNQL
jgi:hypothetical protein